MRENVLVQMPKPVGLKSDFSPSPCKRINKGNGTIRQTVRWIETEYKKENEPSRLLYVQLCEQFEGGVENIHPSVKKAAHLDHHFEQDTPLSAQKYETVNKGRQKYDTSPKYKVNDLTSEVVHHMAGQEVGFSFLEVPIIICGGSIDLMTKTESKLTWLEECLSFFQFLMLLIFSCYSFYCVLFAVCSISLACPG